MPTDLTPAEANRLFYAENAELYDTTEACLTSDHGRRRLDSAISRALPHLPQQARILDAGGGSGNASQFLAQHGLESVLVDVSPEMVAIWAEKARRLGIEPRTQISTLEDFFASDDREWDLIVFSSVLHHLLDPAAVLRQAAEHLAPGGFVVTVFDPLRLSRPGLILRRVDYALWLLLKSPRYLLSRAFARVRPSAADGEAANTGDLAEYHAVTGLDDEALVRSLNDAGVEVVARERFHDARFALTRGAARLMRLPTAFSLVARAPQ